MEKLITLFSPNQNLIESHERERDDLEWGGGVHSNFGNTLLFSFEHINYIGILSVEKTSYRPL